jgi:hypothetical protein
MTPLAETDDTKATPATTKSTATPATMLIGDEATINPDNTVTSAWRRNDVISAAPETMPSTVRAARIAQWGGWQRLHRRRARHISGGNNDDKIVGGSSTVLGR